MYVDDPMILELIALLKAHGVRHAVISPGSRHYPIVRSLEADPDFQLYSVVDERSAGFFAIGVIRAVDAPVAVVTTSGTASVNLASSMADAYYQRLPLVAITADRLAPLLDQMEDQMIDQTGLFAGTLRARALLRPIRDDMDRWYDNRVLNEALLALRVNGTGPVHINVPIARHTGLSYSVKELPAARVISYHTPTSPGTDWSGVGRRLRDKRVLVLWGQSGPVSAGTLDAIEYFTARTDSVIVADHLGNLHHPAVLPSAFTALRSGRTRSGALTPDVVITVGGTLFLIGEVKDLVKGHKVEHWRVDPDGRIMDPFQQLTDIFQVAPAEFFLRAVEEESPVDHSSYRTIAARVAAKRPRLPSQYGELTAVGALLRYLPANSALHIANSAPMRMAHLYPIDPSVVVLGNRGVNGIDGSMSATVGYAAASGRRTFLAIGDLSFFYDMNSLGIRHVPAGLRILLINNGGGALMHDPLPRSMADQTEEHTSAGHDLSARGWAESVGFRYLSASDAESLEASMIELTALSDENPILLEVFTDKISDIEQFKNFRFTNALSGASAYLRARSIAGRTLRRLELRG